MPNIDEYDQPFKYIGTTAIPDSSEYQVVDILDKDNQKGILKKIWKAASTAVHQTGRECDRLWDRIRKELNRHKGVENLSMAAWIAGYYSEIKYIYWRKDSTEYSSIMVQFLQETKCVMRWTSRDNKPMSAVFTVSKDDRVEVLPGQVLFYWQKSGVLTEADLSNPRDSRWEKEHGLVPLLFADLTGSCSMVVDNLAIIYDGDKPQQFVVGNEDLIRIELDTMVTGIEYNSGQGHERIYQGWRVFGINQNKIIWFRIRNSEYTPQDQLGIPVIISGYKIDLSPVIVHSWCTEDQLKTRLQNGEGIIGVAPWVDQQQALMTLIRVTKI